MTSFKLDSLSIFLILLFVIVFAMVFKHSWDAMLETKPIEGFAGMTLDGYAGKVELVYDNIYFDPSNNILLEKPSTSVIATADTIVTRDNFDWEAYIAKYKDLRDAGINTLEKAFKHYSDWGKDEKHREKRVFLDIVKKPREDDTTSLIHKSENGVYVVCVPFGNATFIHAMSDTNNFISQYYNGTSKSEKSYQSGNDLISTETGTDVAGKKLEDIVYDATDDHMLKTQAVKVDGSKFLVAMKYASSEVLVGFTATDPFDKLVDKQRVNDAEGDVEEGKNEDIKLKYGDYEVTLPQGAVDSLASNLGNKMGSIVGNMFMKNEDYNNDYIHKTQIVPGMGYDHYNYPQYGNSRRDGGRRGYGYYDRDVREEERDGPRDENGNLLRDFGEGSASLLRDGAKGTASLVRDTARGASDLAKETVTGTRDLAKDTVTGTRDLAKDTVTGTRDLAKDTVTGTRDLAKDTASGAANAIGNTLSGTGDFIQSSASGIGNFAKDAVGGTVGLGKDIVGGTVGLGKDIVGGVGSGVSQMLQSNPASVGGRGGQGQWQGQGGYQAYGHQNSYGGPNMRQTHGMDPYSYHGAVPPRPSCNYIPRTADFSAFGR